ncbi:hypothetical protein ACWJJH_13110 [Endozoicomonadaceae bacterium StTr2]
MKRLTTFLACAALSVNVLAAGISEKEASDYFWNKIIEKIQNEDPAYFDIFSKQAKITYKLPESYEMKSGDITLAEYKQSQETLWEYTENHSFDLEKPAIKAEGDKTVITTTLFERYTMQGYTLSNKTEQKYVLSKVDGKLKVVEFDNIVSDTTDQEYQDWKKDKK